MFRNGLRTFGNLILALVMAAPLAAVTAWLLHSAACLYDNGLPLCQRADGRWIVVLLALAVVLGPAAWLATTRAARYAGRTGYARPVAPAGMRPAEFVTGLVGALRPEPQWGDHPRDYFGETVAVPFRDGPEESKRLVVDWADFWQFLNDAWTRQRKYESREMSEGPLSSKYWCQHIGRDTWAAYMEMLRSASALKGSPYKPLLRAAPWAIFESVRERWQA